MTLFYPSSHARRKRPIRDPFLQERRYKNFQETLSSSSTRRKNMTNRPFKPTAILFLALLSLVMPVTIHGHSIDNNQQRRLPNDGMFGWFKSGISVVQDVGKNIGQAFNGNDKDKNQSNKNGQAFSNNKGQDDKSNAPNGNANTVGNSGGNKVNWMQNDAKNDNKDDAVKQNDDKQKDDTVKQNDDKQKEDANKQDSDKQKEDAAKQNDDKQKEDANKQDGDKQKDDEKVPQTVPETPRPTNRPTRRPTNRPTQNPTVSPVQITSSPTPVPSPKPTQSPTTMAPTGRPTSRPTLKPTAQPTNHPSPSPTISPTLATAAPTSRFHSVLNTKKIQKLQFPKTAEVSLEFSLWFEDEKGSAVTSSTMTGEAEMNVITSLQFLFCHRGNVDFQALGLGDYDPHSLCMFHDNMVTAGWEVMAEDQSAASEIDAKLSSMVGGDQQSTNSDIDAKLSTMAVQGEQVEGDDDDDDDDGTDEEASNVNMDAKFAGLVGSYTHQGNGNRRLLVDGTVLLEPPRVNIIDHFHAQSPLTWTTWRFTWSVARIGSSLFYEAMSTLPDPNKNNRVKEEDLVDASVDIMQRVLEAALRQNIQDGTLNTVLHNNLQTQAQASIKGKEWTTFGEGAPEEVATNTVSTSDSEGGDDDGDLVWDGMVLIPHPFHTLRLVGIAMLTTTLAFIAMLIILSQKRKRTRLAEQRRLREGKGLLRSAEGVEKMLQSTKDTSLIRCRDARMIDGDDSGYHDRTESHTFSSTSDSSRDGAKRSQSMDEEDDDDDMRIPMPHNLR